MIKPDLILYGVYTTGYEGPHANFRELEDAHEWGVGKFGIGEYYVLENYARWHPEDAND